LTLLEKFSFQYVNAH